MIKIIINKDFIIKKKEHINIQVEVFIKDNVNVEEFHHTYHYKKHPKHFIIQVFSFLLKVFIFLHSFPFLY